MNIELITFLLFASLIFLLATGLPIAFCMGSVGLLFAFIFLGPNSIAIGITSISGLLSTFPFLAVPLFVFMAVVLDSSGLVDALYETMYRWFGGLRGGLAIGTVVICTLFAAMSGVSAAGTVAMGTIALPAMLKRKYDSNIAIGPIAAGGALGQLIPPSGMMIIYSLIAGESVGRLFLGGIVPGLMLAAGFIIYIAIICHLKPLLGPPIPQNERVDLVTKITSLKTIILPVILIFAVLGTIFTGIATPTEAAALGAFGSIICTGIYKKLTFKNLSKATHTSIQLSCMILWLMIGGMIFASVYTAIGAQRFITELVTGMQVAQWMVIAVIQIIWIILGMLMDPNGIMFITMPVFLPIINAFGLSPLWFGVLWVVNMELGYLTPPFGMNLFLLKAVAPKEITMLTIYKSVIPFICVQAIVLILCTVFHDIILFLPNLLMGKV